MGEDKPQVYNYIDVLLKNFGLDQISLPIFGPPPDLSKMVNRRTFNSIKCLKSLSSQAIAMGSIPCQLVMFILLHAHNLD